MDTVSIIKDQIVDASEGMKDFMEEDSWPGIIEQLSDRTNLSDEQKTTLENEVLFVLLGMSLLKNLQSNIQRELSVDTITANNLYVELNDRIFKVVEKWLPTQEEPAEQTITIENAQEIHPTTVPGETVHEVPHTEPTTNPSTLLGASNLKPTTNNEQPTTIPEPQKPAGPQYKGSLDPYREPLQ